MKKRDQEIGAQTPLPKTRTVSVKVWRPPSKTRRVMVNVQTPSPKTYTVLVDVEKLPSQPYEVLVECPDASATNQESPSPPNSKWKAAEECQRQTLISQHWRISSRTPAMQMRLCAGS
jgi:hypothetical protein